VCIFGRSGTLMVSCGQKEEAKVEKKMEVAEAKVYKLGLSLAITGPTSDAGDPYSKGVEDYFQYVNDMKLLGKDTIELKSETISIRPTLPNVILKTSSPRVSFFISTTLLVAPWPLKKISMKRRCRPSRPRFTPAT
jgi:hypothetical protein